MGDDDNNHNEIQANIIEKNIEEVDNIKNKLSNKLSDAKLIETRLKEAEQAYDDATTEEEKEEKEGIYLQVLQRYNNVYNEFNILQEEHKNLIIELQKNISLYKNMSDNPIYKKIEANINEYLDYMKKAEEGQAGGKKKSKGKSKKVSKKPVVSQKKQSEYKEILGKKMKIYKMPDSRKEYVKYKGELLHIADYKNLMKQKATAKSKK